MLKLFWARSTCALATHIVLEECNARYELARVDMQNGGQQAPEFLALNPKGRVPTLVTDQGVLTETPALLVYLAQRFPQAGLAPIDDPFAFARVQAFNSYLVSTVHVAYAHGRRGARWSDDAAAHESMKRKVPQNMQESFALIEKEMFVGPWSMGDAYTICDPYLFTIAGWLASVGVELSQFPEVHAFQQRMSERPAVRRALAAQASAA